MQRRLVLFEWAIRYTLREKENFDVLEGFLSELLREDVTILDVIESKSRYQFSDAECNRIHLKTRFGSGEIVAIEILINRGSYRHERLLNQAWQIVTEHMPEGEPFAEAVKFISVNILYFTLGKGDDYVYHVSTSFKGLHSVT